MRREPGLDLVKWLAMLSMLLDHLRYLWPDTYGLFVIGRLAFPLFCLGIAANVTRTQPGELASDGNARYLGWLTAFSVLSEVPYRLLSPDSATFNVMPTLFAGTAGCVGCAPWQSQQRAVGGGSTDLLCVDASAPDVRCHRSVAASCLCPGSQGAAMVVAACCLSGIGQWAKPMGCGIGGNPGDTSYIRHSKRGRDSGACSTALRHLL